MHGVRTHRTASRTRKGIFIQAATAAAVGFLTIPAARTARAADVHWNVADGNWATPENWVWDNAGTPTNSVPVATDRALLDFASGVTHVTTDLSDDVLSISVKNGSTLSVESGGIVGTTAGGVDANDTIRIGDAGIGSAIVLDGGRLRNNTASGLGADIYVGILAGGVGSVTQSGATSLVFGRDLRIGSDAGSGSYTLSGGTAQTNWTIVGRTGGTGVLTVNGGTLLANNTTGARLQVADSFASTGTVNLLSGTISTTGEVNIGVGAGTGNGNGTMTHTGGLLTALNTVSVGRGGSNTGTNRGFGSYTLGADASSTASIDVNFTPGTPPTNGHFVIGMNGGKGDMTMNGGSITTDAGFYVGYNDAGNVANRSEGNFNFKAGTIGVGGIFAVGYEAASGTMTMDGGTITTTGISGVGYDDRTNNGRTTLTIGAFNQHGGTINANGGFTVSTGSGSGAYTLDNNAVLNVGTGTTGDLVLGGTDPVTAAHTQSGQVNIAGNAAVTVAGGLHMGQAGGKGTLTMSGGTLRANANSFIGENRGGTAAAPIVPVVIFNLNGGAATFGGSLTLGDAGQTNCTLNITAGTLNVTGALVAGRQTTVAGVINQSGGTVTAGSVGIRTGSGSVAACDYNLSGGTLNTGVVTNNSTLDLSSTGVANVGAVGGSGSVTVAGSAALNASSVRQNSLAMTGGAVKITDTTSGTAAGVSVIPSYSLSGTARFDLRDNKLITSVSPGATTAGIYSGVQGDVQRAYNFGAWDQPGLTTSKSDAAAGLTTIGVATGAQVRGLGATDTDTFAGQTINGASTIAMYTYAGDANLDGTIDGGDYGIIDNFAQVPGAGSYANGDFNYDGVIDGGDYGIIDNNIQAQGAPFSTAGAVELGALSGVTAVPEPSACGLAVLASAVAVGRRRLRQPKHRAHCG